MCEICSKSLLILDIVLLCLLLTLNKETPAGYATRVYLLILLLTSKINMEEVKKSYKIGQDRETVFA